MTVSHESFITSNADISFQSGNVTRPAYTSVVFMFTAPLQVPFVIDRVSDRSAYVATREPVVHGPSGQAGKLG